MRKYTRTGHREVLRPNTRSAPSADATPTDALPAALAPGPGLLGTLVALLVVALVALRRR